MHRVMGLDDRDGWMRLCIRLAVLGLGDTVGNPMLARRHEYIGRITFWRRDDLIVFHGPPFLRAQRQTLTIFHAKQREKPLANPRL